MNSIQPSSHPAHDEIWALLPWYANGTLRGAERARVEMHLQQCGTCSRDLEIETRMLAVFQREPVLESSSQAGFERLRERINREASQTRRSPVSRSSALRDWFDRVGAAFANVGWRPALVLMPVLALVLLVPLLLQLPDGVVGPTDTGYRTLAGADSNTARIDEVHLIFAPDTPPERIQALLASVQGEIVAGPSSIGVYTIRPRQTGNAGQGLLNMIESLRQRPEVVFAEAAQPMAVPRPGGDGPR